VFGDSVVDAGTNNYFPSLLRANFKPYGAQFGKPTGRFTNGRTYADFIGLYSQQSYSFNSNEKCSVVAANKSDTNCIHLV
jgi:hypothetical protein